jgi:hypothetical protein
MQVDAETASTESIVNVEVLPGQKEHEEATPSILLGLPFSPHQYPNGGVTHPSKTP